MCDKLVFDLSQEVEGTPNVFVRKDWINILDNQNQNYNNNQSIIDTSQLSNSNKYMSYREAYLSIPMMLTYGTGATPTFNTNSDFNTDGNALDLSLFKPADTATSLDYSIGLKNWFGQIIHSFTLDYNGTTIVQQTPYINMWNSFKLMTSLSLNDVSSQGATIGFFPDDPTTWGFYNFSASTATPVASWTAVSATGSTDSLSGQGVVNNTNYSISNITTGAFNAYGSLTGNDGFLKRQQLINYDENALAGKGATVADGASNIALSTVLPLSNGINNLWKSCISNKQNETATTSADGASLASSTAGIIQYTIIATVYLKHIHSFFNMTPLLKGVFMKMTLNLNNTSSTIKVLGYSSSATVYKATGMQCTSVSNPLGGVNPVMIASGISNNGGQGLLNRNITTVGATQSSSINFTYIANLSVGGKCLDQTLTSLGKTVETSMSKSVYLYVPAMTFNPTFEQAYLSNSVKQIKYTDVYQYQILNIGKTAQINNLVTNGIANIKSVLVLPFLASNGNKITTRYGVDNNDNSGFISGVNVFQSPFDPAGTGPTSPLCHLTNFNVQISGQNAIYNTQKYAFEQFNNQLYGQNAVNGGLTDGITSGLIDRQAFDLEYCYYYVNVERMLPVEMSVPKSVQILGTNTTQKTLDLYVFVEYGVEIQIDALTGARV
jgi:hypothetical protein